MKRTAAITGIVAALAVAVSALPSTAAVARSSSSQNIVQVAASAPQFSTLVSLVKAAGLVKPLEKDTLTVFAPTNRAFRALQRSHPKLYNMVAHSKKLLTEVLEYHVVAGRYGAARVERLHHLKSLLGQRLKVGVRNGHVYINQAKVTVANIHASNGVIHEINAVLIPKVSMASPPFTG